MLIDMLHQIFINKIYQKIKFKIINCQIARIITCCAKLLESYWLGAMQLIRNCMGEVRAKLVIVI